MSAEVVAKKRGRPKKADVPDLLKDQAKESSKSRLTKSSTSARSFSTTETVSSTLVPKKSTKRKEKTPLDREEVPEVPQLKQSAKTTTTRPRIHRSIILSQATAFEKQEAQIADDKTANIEPFAEKTNIAIQAKTTTKEMQLPQLETSNQTHQSNTVMKELLSQHKNEQNPALKPLPSSKQSSFLADFLSRSDPAPEISEDSKISDRSAFSSKAPSIDDIVAGMGVSNLSTLEAATLQMNSRPVRSSAIPITPPKSFKGLTLTRFPDNSEQTKAARRIDPATYATGSFSTFKSTQPLSTPASMSNAPLQGTNKLSTSSQAPTSQQHTVPSQMSSKPQPSTASTPGVSEAAPPPPSPAPSPSSQPLRPATASATLSQPRAVINPVNSQLPRGPRIPGEKRRPTEMSPAELRANPEFKALRRKWTGLIVGIPVLVATSYVLWNRFNLTTVDDGGLGGLGWDYGKTKEYGRERGVLPSPRDSAIKTADDTNEWAGNK